MNRLLAYSAQIVRFAKAHPRALAAGVVAAVLMLVFVASSLSGEDRETALVIAPKEFLQQVSVSGKVQSSSAVTLSFEETGRVSSILVSVGDTVAVGTPLIYLDSGTLVADLRAAEAEVAVKRVELENRGANLEEVRREQDTLVASALRSLLSEGLVAVPASDGYDQTAPVISGVYDSEEEGTYKFAVENRAGGSRDSELRVFNLERVLETPVLEGGEPTALGTRGLYVSFPDGPRAYNGTTWYVTVPNVKSSSYLENFNAYQAAVRARDKAIADAEAELSERSVGTTIAVAELRKAEAEVERVRAELARRSLRAPFTGVVTAVDIDVGEAVSVNDPAVSLISAGELEIESFVPEINISHITVGDPAVITLDAYGEGEPFSARVVSIDPAETLRDGVSTYRVKLHFEGQDERIRSGMTANIVITTDRRDGVVSVPQGVVIPKDGRSYVPVLVGGKETLREVVLGMYSSLGEVEVVSGLSPGDVVLLNGSVR